jgi:hypothetical protein
MEKEEFLKLLPKLIMEDNEVKGAIISILSGIVATKDDIKQVIEHSDKRFEALQAQMDKRFEAMDKRFEAMDKRFETLQAQMDKRFEAMDKISALKPYKHKWINALKPWISALKPYKHKWINALKPWISALKPYKHKWINALKHNIKR